MLPSERLKELKAKTPQEKRGILHDLAEGCPIQPWPYGMPSSALPHVVLLGMSPGNSPAPEDRDLETKNKSYDEPTFGSAHSGFFYNDTKRYWEKVRDLCHFLVCRDQPGLSLNDALAVSSHLNLGTGRHGQADKDALDDAIVRWVSGLLSTKLQAKVLIGFGVTGALADRRISTLWNYQDGLQIDWTRPTVCRKFARNNFRFWAPVRSDGSRMAVLLWPNHPSKPPFSGGPDTDGWRDSKHEADKLLRENGF
jgi:hypothetical protein